MILYSKQLRINECGLCGVNDDLDDDNHGDAIKEEKIVDNKTQEEF